MELIPSSNLKTGNAKRKKSMLSNHDKKKRVSFLRRIKISTRLAVSFSMLVLLSIVITALSIFSIDLQNNISTEIFKDNMTILNHLKKLSSANSNITIYAKELGTAYAVTETSTPVIKMRQAKEELRMYTNEYLAAVHKIIEDDEARLQFLRTLSEDDITELESYTSTITKLINFLESTKFNQIDGLIREALAGEGGLKTLYLDNFSADTAEFIDNTINSTYEFHVQSTYRSVEKINNLTNNISMVIIAFVMFAILISIYFAVNISRSINKPLKILIDVTNKISNGNLALHIDDDSRDEIGILNKAYTKLIGALTMLQQETVALTEHERMGLTYESSKALVFEGIFLDIFNNIDAMIHDEHDITEKTINCVNAIGNGNFDVYLQEFPGKKYKFNEAVETLRKNLKGVHNEILKLIDASINGQLKTRGSTANFSGDWTKLISGLNLLMDKNIEPVDEAASALEKISSGDLTTRIISHYSGDHANIKNGLNNTIDKISMYVQDISSILSEMSNENFNLEVTHDYIGDFAAIKESLNMIIDKFNGILHDINKSSGNILNGSRKIAESSANLSQNAFEQSDKINEMTLKMSVVLEQTDQNTHKAQSAVKLAIDAKENAAEGDSHMREMFDAMNKIQESSKNISNIIKVINDIALQTNLLAINAAIEAAKAGSSGKGFAVVAEEVRSLAGRSKKAASETTDLIENSLATVAKGNRIYQSTADSLAKIIVSVENIANIISEISATSENQNMSIRQINTDITQINEINKVNVEVYKEEAEYAQNLEKQADLFKETVMRYKLKQVVK